MNRVLDPFTLGRCTPPRFLMKKGPSMTHKSILQPLRSLECTGGFCSHPLCTAQQIANECWKLPGFTLIYTSCQIINLSVLTKPNKEPQSFNLSCEQQPSCMAERASQSIGDSCTRTCSPNPRQLLFACVFFPLSVWSVLSSIWYLPKGTSRLVPRS